ncbi:GerAB/ArcD/ProY family transporter [Paenibacillus hodogayensis]|uniref:GerAB/ArcD/ProY family transporter n=1 Tax=Paenibacillus hodogayensis TaxID=279208 RepID=A0ABV5W6I1_9BACL
MSRRLVFVLFVQIHLAAMSSNFAVKILEATSRGHWEAIAVGCLLEAGLVAIYLRGLSAFPGKTIADILGETFGVWGTRLILAPLILFLFIHILLLFRYQITQINIVLLPQTPLWAPALLYLAISLYAAVKGIKVIARLSVALLFVFVPFVLFSLFISYANFDYRNMFPIWDPQLHFVKSPSFYVSLLSSSGFLFLGLLPPGKPLQWRVVWPAMLILAAFYLSFVYTPLLIFGQETALLLQFPTVMASDTVDLEWIVFDWLPAFFVVASSALGTLEVSLLLWMTIALTKKLFIPAKEKWIALAVGIAAYVLFFQIPNLQVLNRYYSWSTYLLLYSILVIPLATYASGIRKRRASV